MSISSTLRKNKYSVIIAVGIVIILVVAIPVFASGGTAVLNFAISMVEDIFDMSALTKVSEMLTADMSETYPELWEMMETLVDNVITPAAYSILGIYLVITIINIGMQPQQATAMQFLRPCAWFIAAAILIQYTPRLIIFGISFAGELATDVVDAASSAAETTGMVETITEYLESTTVNVATALVHVGQLLLPWIAAQVTGLVIQLQAFAAIIEIFVRAIFMPLSFGPMIMHGFNQEGTRYLRAFLACCLKVVLMVAVGIICSYLVGSFLTIETAAEYADACVKVLCIEFAMIFLLKKCGDIANDVIGV